MLKTKHQLTTLIFGIFLFAGAILPVTIFAQDYEDSYFGIFASHTHNSFQYFKNQTGMSEQDFYNWADAHRDILKFHWSRAGLQYMWYFVEPVLGGGYDWDNVQDTDDVTKAVYAQGQLNLVAVISPDRHGAAGEDWWDHEVSCKNFIRAVVEHYDGDGTGDADENVRVKMWQAGNEVLGWEGKGWTQDQYVTFVTWMEEAVHDADPDAKIMLISSQRGAPYMPFLKETIDDLIAAGVPFDAVDIHNWAPYDDDGVPGFTMAEVEDCRSFLDSRGLYDVEIFTGENGSWFGCPISPVTGEPEPVQTEQEQARFLAQRIAYSPSVGLDHYLWNNLCEWYCFGSDPNRIFNSMGLVSDGANNCEVTKRLNTERICYWTYKILAEAIDKPANSFVGEMSLTVANNRYGYEYKETATALHKYILWSWVGDQNVIFPINTSSAHVVNLITDRYGNILEEYDVDVVAGEITITIHDDPVFIEEISTTSIEETGGITPKEFQLNQNYPNPFNLQTTIRYQLSVSGKVTLKIYDMLGQEVRTLVDKNKIAGEYSVTWDGKDSSGQRVTSSIYFYSLKLDNSYSITNRMLLMK